MKRIEILPYEEEKKEIHFVDGNSDLTICGLSIEDKRQNYPMGRIVDRPVNCSHCLHLLKIVKEVKLKPLEEKKIK